MLTIAAALAVIGGIIRLMSHWVLPSRRLRKSLEKLLAGETPIEEFRPPTGGMAPLGPQLQTLLEELRARRAEIVQLRSEMRQRVAQRTDALERKVGSLQAQATRDSLTGLYNRRTLEQCLEEAVARCTAENESLCIMMLDVDDFKLLNDTMGHAAGDEFLRSVGQLIRSTIRAQDMPFRCGGDEFMILMPGSGHLEGQALAKRLIELVDGLARPLPVPRKPRVSVGLSTLSHARGISTGQQLMESADQQLYQVKSQRKAGRSKVA